MGHELGATSVFRAQKRKCAVWNAATMFLYTQKKNFFGTSWSHEYFIM
jgi:hypothetical protein